MTIAQIITVIIGLLIAIFRNQLSSIGDKLTANRKFIWNLITEIIYLLLFLVSPVYYIIKTFTVDKLDKLFVFNIFFYSLVLIFGFVSLLFTSLSKKMTAFEDKQLHADLDRIEEQLTDAKNMYQSQNKSNPLLEADISRMEEALKKERQKLEDKIKNKM